jgi:ABC-type branched-subunit amino acid transport system substrate-binding protein
LAVMEINTTGGINGKKVNWIIEDEGPNRATALLAVRKVVEEGKACVIVGCTTSEAVMAVGSYVADKGVPLISPSATSVELSRQSWSNWVFCVSPDDSLQGGVIAKLIKDKGLKKVAFMVQDTAYGNSVAPLTREFLKGRTDVIISLRYDPTKLSYLTELNVIMDKKPDCVMHIGAYEDSAAIYKQASQYSMGNIPWFTGDGAYDMPLDQYPDAAKFMEKAVTGTVHIPDLQSEAYKKFDESYTNAFNITPTIYCDTSYDAMNLALMAIEKSQLYDGKSIRDNIYLANYVGASGMITFDEKGSRLAGNYGIWKVVNQNSRYIYTLTGESISFLKPK